MKLLLDSHSLLWHANGDLQMSATATSLLVDATNDLYLSMASILEIAIKGGLKKLTLSAPFDTFMTRAITGYGLTVLYERLPFPDKPHRDPFDRMIVIHAQRDGLSVVGVDMAVDSYGVTQLW